MNKIVRKKASHKLCYQCVHYYIRVIFFIEINIKVSNFYIKYETAKHTQKASIIESGIFSAFLSYFLFLLLLHFTI